MGKQCIGIDLGGTFTKFALLDEAQQLHGLFQLPTPSDRGAAGVIEQILIGARRLMDTHGLSTSDVVAVGLGSPGPLDLDEGVILGMPNVDDMVNVPIRAAVFEGLGIRTQLENDANAAAYGEYLCGKGPGKLDLVMLTLGTGLGSGIIIDGCIVHGSHGIGAEMGHVIVDPGGEQCGCGQRGCLERYCSATHMANYAARRITQDGRDSSLKDVLAAKGTVDGQDVNEARRAGDALAAEVWDRAMRYLAVGCVNICRMLDPDEIILTGGLTNAGDDLMEPLMEHFAQMHWSLAEPMTRIRPSALGNTAGVIGAAGVAWQAFAPGAL